MTSKVRGWLYVGQIVLAVFALGLGVAIVLFNAVTLDQVMEILLVAGSIYVGFTGWLARANLSPPSMD